jgi:hypothetical protein
MCHCGGDTALGNGIAVLERRTGFPRWLAIYISTSLEVLMRESWYDATSKLITKKNGTIARTPTPVFIRARRF